ncbi:MAG TPA: DNRLRE domain-containing protein [Polyangiales bacterium]|nr:DNRLRE domain-containing protein [Polyangiales bacterium]
MTKNQRLLVRLCLLACSLFLFVATAAAQTLTRGPYLQNGSTSAISIRWRTSAATDSVVRYGTSAGSLTQSLSDGALVSDHELRLTGLAPNTTYYYSVGSGSSTLASGPNTFFVTAPSGAKPTRIWVLGDPGTGNSSQAAVRDAYYNFTGARHTDLWLMLGDNAYADGTDAQYQSTLFNIYGTMLRKSVLWPTLGNHDGHSASSASQTGPYYQVFTMPRSGESGGVASGTEAYYSFNYGNIHFVCLNSYDVSRATSGAMLTWLVNDLNSNNKDWLFAFFHHPPYSKGSHNSDSESELIEMRQNALPILESHGADLVLAGHSHAYERSKLLDGHYGSSGSLSSAMVLDSTSGREDSTGAYLKSALGPVPNDGTVYAVAGASGQISGGSLNHPAMYISLNVLGSMVLDVDGDRLDAQYLDNNGTRRDYFTILKGGSGNAPPSVSITSPASGASFSAPATVNIAASAADSDGSVSRVDFYANGTLLGGDSTSPYNFAWSAPVGSHSLTAIASDNLGAARTSAAVAISVSGVSGATTVSFQNGVASYNGMVDASLRSDNASTNYGAASTLVIDGSPDYAAVLRWDLSSIPSGKTVTAASLTFNVVDTSSQSYALYALKRAFNEASVTWQSTSSGVSWQTAGANGGNDRETTVLGSVVGSASGTLSVTLNAAGLAKLQTWINSPASNFGFVLLDYAQSNGLDVSSSEASTVSQRPKLTVSYQ